MYLPEAIQFLHQYTWFENRRGRINIIIFLQLVNYFVAAGLRSGGSNAAGGIGSMLADWIVNGTPPMDTYDLDILRFLPAHNNRKFLLDRVREVPG